MLMEARGPSERSAQWVKSLPSVTVALNNETIRLLGMKTKNTIKARLGEVTHTPSQPARWAIGLEEAITSDYSITIVARDLF